MQLPSCGHRLNTYIPGLTEVGTPDADPNGFQERQQQRYLERGVRRWKRRATVAITDKEEAIAKRKVSEWQTKAREFVEENDRKRKYSRESVTRAR